MFLCDTRQVVSAHRYSHCVFCVRAESGVVRHASSTQVVLPKLLLHSCTREDGSILASLSRRLVSSFYPHLMRSGLERVGPLCPGGDVNPLFSTACGKFWRRTLDLCEICPELALFAPLNIGAGYVNPFSRETCTCCVLAGWSER